MREKDISRELERLRKDCETLDQKGTWGQLTEFMNTALDVLDTVYQMEIRPPYPQARMEHFLRVLGGQIGRIISTRLNTVAEQVRGMILVLREGSFPAG